MISHSPPLQKNNNDNKKNNMKLSEAFFERHSTRSFHGIRFCNVTKATTTCGGSDDVYKNTVDIIDMKARPVKKLIRRNRTAEDRRQLRKAYIIALQKLVKKGNNRGFKIEEWKSFLEEKKLEHITIHRHNDLVESFTAIARQYGIVFFRDYRDNYYVDDTHAVYWGLCMRPRSINVSAGSQRGLQQMIGKSTYRVSSRVSRFMETHNECIIDADVLNYCYGDANK